MKNKKKKKTPVALLIVAALAGIIFALIGTAGFTVMKVQGAAMEPQVLQGNWVLVNKLAYVFQDPKPGDVVTFPCNVYNEDGEGNMLVKRVAAIEGDLVEVKEGVLYVNKKIHNKHMAEPIYMESMEPIIVAEDRVFVLSDNRECVMDSRDSAVGQLPVWELEKVCFK